MEGRNCIRKQRLKYIKRIAPNVRCRKYAEVEEVNRGHTRLAGCLKPFYGQTVKEKELRVLITEYDAELSVSFSPESLR